MTSARTERNEAIRAEHAAGDGYRTLAVRYDVTPQRIRQIVHPDRYAMAERARRQRRRAEAAAGEGA